MEERELAEVISKVLYPNDNHEQGKLLRLFEPDTAKACMKAFAREYDRGKIFAGIKRIVLKEYPDEAREALEEAGFRKEMQDYVLYRS